MKLTSVCDRKQKHKLEENCKVLASIIGTIVTLGNLGLPCCGHCDDSSKGRRVLKWWDW